MAPDAGWCPRCFIRRAPDRPEDEFPAHMRMWYPQEAPLPPQEFSRWRGGTTTFGPVGRLTITAALMLVQVLWWALVGLDGILVLGISYLMTTGLSIWVLAHVWKRDRVR